MRKLIFIGLLLALFGTVGCKKDNLKNTSQPTKLAMSSDGNMLIFESIEAFEEVVNDLDEVKEKELSKQLSTLEYNNYFSIAPPASKDNTVQEMDKVLGQLLNQDGILQIGTHLIKVSLNTDQVFVASADNKETIYSDLRRGDVSNKNIQVYTTGDDVLSILGNKADAKCGGIGGGTYPCYAQAYQGQIIATLGGGIVWRLNPGVKFFRAGIYYRLSSLYDIWAYPSSSATSGGSKVNNTSGLFTIEMFCRYPQGWYQKRPCSGGSIGTQTPGFYYSSTSAAYQKTFYSGTRNLNGYYFYVQGRVRFPDGSVTTASPYGGRNINSPY